MSTLVFAALTAGAAVGLLLTASGLTGRQVFNGVDLDTLVARVSSACTRYALIGVAAVFVFAATGWIVGAVFAAITARALPSLLGGKSARASAVARTEAIASWTEMIRDSIVAASGLEEAIVATASVAPASIAAEVRTMVHRLGHQRLTDALVAFGRDLHHPSGDLVVTALVTATRLEASDLSGLLTRLAEATRGEARMRIRVEVGRTRVRTATNIIVGVVIAAALFLSVANGDYLDVYDTAIGQAVLTAVGGVFAFGGWLLTRMAAIEMPERFTARALAPGGDA